jgi:hypothetical protein
MLKSVRNDFIVLFSFTLQRFPHLGASTQQLNPQRMLLGQQQEDLQSPFSYDASSLLFLAYKCKELNPMAWNDCKHPYCVMVRGNLAHMRQCYAGVGDCKRCQKFDEQIFKHAGGCTLTNCPVDMCRNTKQQLQLELASLPYDHNNPLMPHPLQRRNSVGGSDQYYGSALQSGLFSFSQYESLNISEDSPVARYIEARAEEIVKKLEQEEPLLPSETPNAVPPTSLAVPPTSLGRPSSLLRSNTAPIEDYQVNMLSPIAESPPFGPPHLMGGDKSLSLMSSYEQDGLSKAPNSLAVEGKVDMEYPDQQVMHKFRDVS